MNRDNTIFIYTDGGMQKEDITTNTRITNAGLGIHIIHENKAYFYWEALGHQSVLYAELRAIIRSIYVM